MQPERGTFRWKEPCMTDNLPRPVVANPLSPFVGDFEQFFSRMMRWPLMWSDAAANGGQPHLPWSVDHAPKVEVKENGNTYAVMVELPGLDQRDVKVFVEDDVLSISGQKKTERSDEKTHHTER